MSTAPIDTKFKFRIKNGKVDLIKTKAEVRSVVLLEGYWGK
jgi:hypothetical protein